jgi:UDP-glucose 4-epimerase
MAVARLLDASVRGTVFPLLGGHQRRDLTFVDDTVDAFAAALRSDLEPGTVLNVGSGRPVGLDALVALVQRVVGRPLAIEHLPPAPGDVATTHADLDRVRDVLGWVARTELENGIRAQLAATTNSGESQLLRSG